MGFLTPILQSIGIWLLRAVFDEIKEVWSDKRVKDISKDAVIYVQSKFTGSGELKAEVAKQKIVHDLKQAGIEITNNVAKAIVEKAVQRYLKK